MVKIPVAVLGATGAVGQRFIYHLNQHPWFEVVALTGSDRTTGKSFHDSCRWIIPAPMPEWAGEMEVLPSEPNGIDARIVFSALPSGIARKVEPEFANAGIAVCSNASAFRAEPDVPILLPEVNPDHVQLVEIQREKRGWKGAILTNPNCTSTGMTIALKAIQDMVGVKRAFVVSLQALSGAGYPGVPSLDIQDNVIPYIADEEDKVENEPRKMLGKLNGGLIEPAEITISAHTNRVGVSEGHIVCMSVEVLNPSDLSKIREALTGYQPPSICKDLPSTPNPVIQVMDEDDRPQPRLDRNLGNGMTTVVGRLRTDPVFDFKMVVLSHNTIRGAAGGSIYNAELLVKSGLFS